MAVKSRTVAEAIRLKSDFILKELAAGRSRNTIRRELICAGLTQASRPYFNEVVSDLLAGIGANSQVAASASPPNEALAQQQPPTSMSMNAPAPALRRGGNMVDDRFTNDL